MSYIQERETKKLYIGLPKGKLLRSVVDSFSSDELTESLIRNEKIYYFDESRQTEFLVLRCSDLPLALAMGHIDVALGSDVYFHESQLTVRKLSNLDLGTAYRFSLIGKSGTHKESLCTIATSFPLAFKDCLPAGSTVVKYNGSLEAFLMTDRCDYIMDIVNSGYTMKKYGLVEYQNLGSVTHGMWALKASEAKNQLILMYPALLSVLR